MTAPKTDAESARKHLNDVYGETSRGQAFAVLALAAAIESAARVLAGAMVEAARIRAGARK